MSEDDTILVHPDVNEFLIVVDEKTERIVRENRGYLADNPYPGRGQGDKERLTIDGEDRYRMHIGRTWTVFCDIYEDDNEIGVLEILPIDDAHDRYGF